MLITFSSSASSDIVMFDDVARHLLQLIGKAPSSIGVIMPSEFQDALERLAGIPVSLSDVRRAAALDDGDGFTTGDESHDDVNLKVRSHPLVEMIRRAEVEDAPIVWHAAADFASEDNRLSA